MDFKNHLSHLRKTFLLVLLVLATLFTSHAQNEIDHWETIVYDTSIWKYFPGSGDPGTSWNLLNYDDTMWPNGKAGIGYGDGDDRTIISPTLSVFLRKKFTISELDDIGQALLHVDYDDGFIAYINGVEVARSFMGSAINPSFNSPSSGLHEALLYQGISPEGFLLKMETISGLLVEGENILAIRVHNESISSSDLSASGFFSVGVVNNNENYGPLPSWFTEPLVFESSNLPIVIINTNSQSVMDEVRITVDMGIIYNGKDLVNYVTDERNNYNGKISIEYRGESSQLFPKKSFSIETQDLQGNNLNVSLLGLPPENDWVLYAPYTDKTMMRDVLSYKLGNDLGHYAPRTRFVELILNDEYYGVYVLIERIKQDNNRVDIATLNPEDVSGDDISGGYILRVDKIDNNDFPSWTTSSAPRLPGENVINFQYYDPEGTELTDAQRNYIRNFIGEVESSLASPSFISPDVGFSKYIDIPSAIDFMLVNEIGKNIDGYIYSTYLHKDKDSKDRRLHMGPLWDFNLAFGNVDYSQNAQFAPGWMWDDQYRMFWFRRMVEDDGFTKNLKCRWDELRSSFLTNGYFIDAIDSMASRLNEAHVRNYQRWPILGKYVWPNQYVGLTYMDEINFMKQWIISRLQWMDINMPGVCDLITDIEEENPIHFSVYPNPSSNTFTISTSESSGKNLSVEIYNAVGSLVFTSNKSSDVFIWDGDDSAGQDTSPGLYIIRLYIDGKFNGQQKVIKQ